MTVWIVIGVMALTPTVACRVKAEANHLKTADTNPTGPPLGLNLLGVNNILAPRNTATIATGVVRLDGHKLFAIAAPALTGNQNTPTPIQQRIQSIEQRLNRIAHRNFDPATLKVTRQTDPSSGLPVISVNGQYLMTVTTQDADLQSGELGIWADELTEIIRHALIQAQRERQPEFIRRQVILAAALIMFMLAGSLSMSYWQHRLKAQQQTLLARPLIDQEVLATTTADFSSSSENSSTAVEVVQQKLRNRQKSNFKEIQRSLLQIGKYALWGGGSFEILGLFPYTRWLQPIILSGLKVPLKILGIGLGTYLMIRISFILISRLFATLSEREFFASEISQRLALRASTFARVLQSLVAVSLIVGGVLAALAVVGVDLLPLLAGAGVIGLAISFASQSLIKDAINGFLILLEDQYGVGDVIVVGDIAGLVEYMNLRITQLRNSEGRLITIPNSAISIVQNLSKDWSRIDLAIDVTYGTNPDHALQVIKQAVQEIYSDRAWRDKILEPPEILGIDEIDQAGMLIRVWIKTPPLEQWRVAREFRRRLKLKLDQQEIAIEIPKQSVWFGNLMALTERGQDRDDKPKRRQASSQTNRPN
jgi:small conductance mechanosensitive channel